MQTETFLRSCTVAAIMLMAAQGCTVFIGGAWPTKENPIVVNATVPSLPARQRTYELVPLAAPIALVRAILVRRFGSVARSRTDRFDVPPSAGDEPPWEGEEPPPAPTEGSNLGPLVNSALFQSRRIKVPSYIIGSADDRHVHTWIDSQQGDAQVHPSLQNLPTLESIDDRSLIAAAQTHFRALLPDDDSDFTVTIDYLLKEATARTQAGGSADEARPILVYVSANRYIDSLPVHGTCSRAQLVFGSNAELVGMSRFWKTVRPKSIARATIDTDAILDRLHQDLKGSTNDHYFAIVDDIDLVYKQENQQLELAYMYRARLVPKGDAMQASVALVHGYIVVSEVAKAPAPARPHVALAYQGSTVRYSEPASTLSDTPLTVGRYIVRDDIEDWADSAREFSAALRSGNLQFQDHWLRAERRHFVSAASNAPHYVNNVNLALVEAHGDWWSFATSGHNQDVVDLDFDVREPGYGMAANGKLSDLILHSCQVVPGAEETGEWADVWQRIFGGLRTVVGYRTLMYVTDGAPGVYARSLSQYMPLVHSWFMDVASLDIYNYRACSSIGYASSIVACGHEHDSLAADPRVATPHCVRGLWFTDYK